MRLFPIRVQRLATSASLAAAAAALLVPIAAAPASADTLTATTMGSTKSQAKATTASTLYGYYGAGQDLTLVCHTRGEPVRGYYSFEFPNGLDDIWYRTPRGDWVPDVMLNTGSSDPVGPACGGSTPTPTPTPSPVNQSFLDRFVQDNMGRQLWSVWGTDPGQCVSLTGQYLYQAYGVKITGFNNADQYIPGRDAGNQMLRAGFSWHTDGNFRNGDFIVWHAGYNGGDVGHIALWYNGMIYNSNFNHRLTAGLDPMFWGDYAGYWRKN